MLFFCCSCAIEIYYINYAVNLEQHLYRKFICMPVINNFNEQTIRARAAKDGMTHISTGVAVVEYGKILKVRRVPRVIRLVRSLNCRAALMQMNDRTRCCTRAKRRNEYYG